MFEANKFQTWRKTNNCLINDKTYTLLIWKTSIQISTINCSSFNQTAHCVNSSVAIFWETIY